MDEKEYRNWWDCYSVERMTLFAFRFTFTLRVYLDVGEEMYTSIRIYLSISDANIRQKHYKFLSNSWPSPFRTGHGSQLKSSKHGGNFHLCPICNAFCAKWTLANRRYEKQILVKWDLFVLSTLEGWLRSVLTTSNDER